MSIRLKQLGISVFLYLFTTAVFANSHTYDIDIVIFSHITPNTMQSEQWPIVSQDDMRLFDQNTSTNNIKPTYQLQREVKILQNTADYHVLFSGSFRQTWNQIGSSITISVKSDNIAGNFTIQLSHYFDVYANLLLTEPTALLQKMDSRGFFTQWNQSTFSFLFKQHRRMRSRELNYLGNPVVGVLIKINPVMTT